MTYCSTTIAERMSYHVRQVARRAGVPVMSAPLQIDIEPTVRCGLRCPFCQHSSWTRRAGDMPFDFFVKLLDSLPGLEKIKLQGIGEPLLHPRICDMTLAATRRKIATLIFTNGTVLREETARALF